MKSIRNPFITSGYISAEYFCDRETERSLFIRELTGGNNIALISTRRMGKTGLIQHCFNDKELKDRYYTFFIDIYSTKSLRDFVYELSKGILETLKPQGKKASQLFWNTVRSLQAGVTFDFNGVPTLKFGLGDVQQSETTLEELFEYLEKADRPCLVAIDEFQQIAGYSETPTEAILRTHVQRCKNTHFVFAGSRQHVMGAMFQSASRPFYQSVSIMNLESIPLENYAAFARLHFNKSEKDIDSKVIKTVYEQFDGITWYVQKMLHILFELTSKGETCSLALLEKAFPDVLESFKYTYPEILFRLPVKQKELLIALAKEGKTSALTSASFIKKYKLDSASSVQAGMKGLLEKDFVTRELGIYQVYDRFFRIWLAQNY